MTATFQTVKNMFSAYLNQDFDLVFGTVDDAIRAFVQHSAPDEVSRAKHEIRTILAMQLPEEELQKVILQDLGSCYYYPAEWASAQLWLEHVLALLVS
ncbi:contact-dependent growth inhibition system immunity protein [Paraburkholderia sp. DD10]|uniref:contact-dependent growth inhibition system immunity protein n=1 Tax=Paraburkholderia sp. DD10 TaxID=3409691 RepID=UPI003A03DAA6